MIILARLEDIDHNVKDTSYHLNLYLNSQSGEPPSDLKDKPGV